MIHPLLTTLSAGVLGLAGAASASGPAPCLPHDLDASGFVDGADLGALLDSWGEAGALGPADFDRSGAVDGADLGELLGRWGAVPVSACISISGVSPNSGAQGDTVTVTGVFPDTNATNYALSAVTSDGALIPFLVTEVTSTTMTAKVGPIPSNVGEATLVVGHGQGGTTSGGSTSDFTVQGTSWVWTSTEAPIQTSVTFTPEQSESPAGPRFSEQIFGSIMDGILQMTVVIPCAENNEYRFWYWVQGQSTSLGDLQQACVYIPSATLMHILSPSDCAPAFCGVLGPLPVDVFPALSIACEITLNPENFGFQYWVDFLTEAHAGAMVLEMNL